MAAVPDVDRLMNLLNNLSGDKNVEEIQNLVTKLKDTQAKLAETIERKISQGSTDVGELKLAVLMSFIYFLREAVGGKRYN